jgi:hypothetical protein
MPSYYFERALFVVGQQDSGKSVQLRSMFRNVRLGTDGNIPAATNLREMYRLSNERCLYIRLTSPHEMDEYVGSRPDGDEEEELQNFLDMSLITHSSFRPLKRSRVGCVLRGRVMQNRKARSGHTASPGKRGRPAMRKETT